MSKMFNVFHVSLLKRYKVGCRGVVLPPAVLDNGEVDDEVGCVLAHKTSIAGRKSYLVQWKGLPRVKVEWLLVRKEKKILRR